MADPDITKWRPERLDELAASAHADTPGVEILPEPPTDEHDAEHGANFPDEMDEPDADDR